MRQRPALRPRVLHESSADHLPWAPPRGSRGWERQPTGNDLRGQCRDHSTQRDGGGRACGEALRGPARGYDQRRGSRRPGGRAGRRVRVKGGRFAGAVGTRKASRWMSDRNGPRADVMNERSGRTGDRVREALQSRCGLNTPLFRSSARRVPSRQPATRGAGRRNAHR